MSVDAHAVTQLRDRACRLCDCVAGDVPAMIDLVQPSDVQMVPRRSQAVIVSTAQGYEIVCTPSQLLLTPNGYQAASSCQQLVMCGYALRRRRDLDLHGPACLQCTDETLYARLAVVSNEHHRVAGLDLIIDLPDAARARETQWMLLGLGLPSSIVQRRRLRVTQPYAARYVARRTDLSQQLRAHLTMAANMESPTVSAAAQAEIVRLVDAQNLSTCKTHEALVHEMQESYALALHAELRVDECARMVQVLAELPLRADTILRAQLVALLRAQNLDRFVVRVTGVRRHARLDMCSPVGNARPRVLANGFACLGHTTTEWQRGDLR